MDDPKSSIYRVQVLDRALGVLQALAARPGECTLADLSIDVGLHKSTVHRIVMALEHHRLVHKNPENGRYRLGLKLFELGSAAIAATDLREPARPYLNRVLAETGETVHLCLLDNGEVLYVDKLDPQKSIRMSSTIGRRQPAYCTSLGKAILSQLPPDEVESILRRTSLKPRTRHTLTTERQLRAELAQVRSRGYAIDDEENEDGVRCVGAAVLIHSGRPVAAISVSGLAFSMTTDKLPGISRSVVAAAHMLSADLGYRPGATLLPGV
ncbi:MAG: IclR family transcriptional regulator [Terriglobales bacterium]